MRMPLLPRRCALGALLVLTVSVIGLVPSHGQVPSGLECRWADTPPLIDGRGDDAVWLRARQVDNFRQAWITGSPAARQRTRVRLLWDREWIYFLAEMDDTDVTADVREHDGPMWENDVTELFLRPSDQHAGYYEFEVNPFGAVLDAFFPGTQSGQETDPL